MKKQCDVQFRGFMGNDKKLTNVGIIPKIHRIDCGVMCDKPPCMGKERSVSKQVGADIFVFDSDYKAKEPLKDFIPTKGTAEPSAVAADSSIRTSLPSTLARHVWQPLYHKHISAAQLANDGITDTMKEVFDNSKRLPLRLKQPYLDVAWWGLDENLSEEGTVILKIQIEYSYEQMTDPDMYFLVFGNKPPCEVRATGLPSRLFCCGTLNENEEISRVLIKTNGLNIIQVPQPNMRELTDTTYWDTDKSIPVYCAEIDETGNIRPGNITKLPEVKSMWSYE